MSAPKHSPGPWVVTYNSTSTITAVVDGEEVEIAKVETEDDATAMGAVPELLAALKAIYQDYKKLADSGDTGDWKLEEEDVGKQVLAAIAKAEGGAA